MKTISILIPCYNENENVEPISNAVVELFDNRLKNYNYEIVFIDNASNDGTRKKLEVICRKNSKIKAIFNIANFGQFNSPFYGLTQTSGECTILLCCDFQDPIELIPHFIEKWEKGHRIVIAQKTTSKENTIIYFCRSIYYSMLKKISNVNIIEHFTGFGLYDSSFIELLRNLNDSNPFLRGIVAEYGSGFNITTIEYEQAKRRAGKTHNNFFSLYDAAMLSFTNYTKAGLRAATFIGAFVAMASFIIGLFYLVYKLLMWDRFDAGLAPLTIGMFFLGGTILVFLGVVGEYILNINMRVINRPLVIEEKRINF